jgi:hypothetical protein
MPERGEEARHQPVRQPRRPDTVNPPQPDAIMQLLAAIQAIIAAHAPADTDHRCPSCTRDSRRECPELWLAASSLDLAIRSWRLTKGQPPR